LFGNDEQPIGELIRVQAQLFRVAGVLARRGQSANGMDQDDVILMPLTSAQAKIRGRDLPWLDDILASAVSREAVNPAIDRVIALLRQRHHIRGGDEDDFNVRRPDEIIKAQMEASRTLALNLICIALVSLIVGGIGIMNVMLASVVQRTKEIGLRLAVGARESAVQSQFLGEAVMLSLFGGLVGVILGVIGSYVIGYVMDWPMSIPWQGILIAPLFSIAVGVVFGFSPARRAARLDPITALHHE
jgi:putative ABC transport system permease protein